MGAHLAQGGAAVIATHVALGLEGRTLDLGPFRARVPAGDAAAGRVDATPEPFF